jgi:pimeloyl-ACP methyl ester carboxylesterase
LGLLLCAACLGACGGGGSSDSAPPVPVTPPKPPIINTTGAGQLKDAVLLKTITTVEIASALERSGQNALGATPRYAVQAYRLTYLTVDGLGQETLASALVTVPQKPLSSTSPVLSYQHGTITKDADAPSQLANVETPEVVMASLGYIVLSADYVGYGASKGVPHPYLLSAPSAAAVIDLMTAAKYWRETNKVLDNQQLFLAGYSEGGYVTMATHRALQAGNSSFHQNLVSVAPGAGPYNVALTLGEQLKVIRRANPLLGALINPGFLKYLGQTDRNNVRDKLLTEVQGNDSDVVFLPTFLDYFLNDDEASLDRFSSVHDWRPEVAVSLYHGRDDRTVSYLNATNALDTMRARGATSTVNLTDCAVQPAGHKECVVPYWRFMLDQFARQVKNL